MSREGAFDRMTVTIRPGSDVVARKAGVLLVAGTPASDEGDRVLHTVLHLLETGGEGDTRALGYRLSRELRSLFETGGGPSDLALVAATDDGLAVVLAGTGTAAVPERGWRLVCEKGGLLTREVDWPPAPLLLHLGGSGAESTSAAPDHRPARPFDLRAGVVPGSAAVLASPPTAPPAITEAAKAEQLSGTRVLGYPCRAGHLNDPRALFCALCGIRMAESTGVYVEGPRPPLGLLVFDNGASFALDESYLLGREPDIDERVRSGRLRPLVLFDTTGVISRRHAEIRLEDWNVLLVDCGSANGTLVAERGAEHWSALVPGQPIRMRPGMQVRIGERSFVFEPLHGAP
ncbi:MAG: FHA domain-containing protein [Actinomycetota bacterium]|nr:FHA domain-containing protein [Actinomycetota bacterium]